MTQSDSLNKNEPDYKHGTFGILLPQKDAITDEVTGWSEIRGVENEVIVKSSYGIAGTTVSIRIYQLHDSTFASLKPGDPVTLLLGDQKEEILKQMACRIRNIKFAPPKRKGDTWAAHIEAFSESTWWCMRKPIISHVSEKLFGVYDIISRLMFIATKNSPGEKPKVFPGRGHDGIYKYNHLFNDGSLTVRDIIEDIVKENRMEWYMDPFKNSIFVAEQVPTTPLTGESLFDASINRIKFFDIGVQMRKNNETISNGVECMTFLFVGNPLLQVGTSMSLGGKRWKIVKATYAIKGNGYSESTGLCVYGGHTCLPQLMDWFNNSPIDPRTFAEKENNTMIVDFVLGENGTLNNFYRETNKAKWLSFVKRGDPSLGNVDNEKDPRKKEFADGKLVSSAIMTTPFAGDGVGLRIPIPDGGRGVLTFPEKKHGYSLLGGMFWKQDDQIPECEPKDLYLRMEKGSLYFDEQNETWLVKANNVKLEAASPDPANQKPNTGTTTGIYLKIDNSGNIVVEGGTIKLGKNATLAVVVNGDDVNIDATGFQAWLNTHTHPTAAVGPPSPPTNPFIGPKIGDSVASTTKTKAE